MLQDNEALQIAQQMEANSANPETAPKDMPMIASLESPPPPEPCISDKENRILLGTFAVIFSFVL